MFAAAPTLVVEAAAEAAQQGNGSRGRSTDNAAADCDAAVVATAAGW